MKVPFDSIKQDDGKLNFVYRAVVENRVDPLKLGRCKVRVFGVNDINNIKNPDQGIPTEELPWAEAAMGLIEGSVSGFGLWSVPLQGSHVFVFFENGNMMQPRYFASAPGMPEEVPDKTQGFSDPDGVYPRVDRLESDVHRLARGDKTEETLVQHKNDNLDLGVKTSQGGSWDEPVSAYAAEYPDNIVLATHTGITVELDTTLGQERVHVYHPSGSYIEIDHEGNMVIRNANDRFDIVDGSENKHIKKDYNTTVEGSQTNYIVTNETRKVDGDRKTTIMGNETELVKGNVAITVSGKVDITVTGECNVTADTIDLDGSGGGGVNGGVVTGKCTCAYTGQPHPHSSSNVNSSL